MSEEVNNNKKKVIVIKCGGSIINDFSELNILSSTIASLKNIGFQIIVVHGGGADITKLCARLKIESKFINGQRKTTEDILEATQMSLLGNINCNLVYQLNHANVLSIGLSGHDANLINADFIDKEKLGFVGKVKQVNVTLLSNLLNIGVTPVIAPLGVDSSNNGNTYNINADLAAAEIAKAVNADQLILLSDIDGFYADINDPKSLVSVLTTTQIQEMLNENKVSGGMIPKLTACNIALSGKLASAHIINGNNPEQLFTIAMNSNALVGTRIIRK
ncbi:MAG: acetylglutamate kinase [Neisseriaceae bacterium]